MAGFNYGGGPGDGTGWSSERGNEPAPGGGSSGHGGDRDSGGSSGKGNSGRTSVSRAIGDKVARGFGINPADLTAYYINEDGDLIGIAIFGGGYSVVLGPAPAEAFTGKGNNASNHGEQPNGIPGYRGDISDARIATLNKIIADNARFANSTQSGRRITKARKDTRQAQAELAVINTVRKQKAEKQAAEAKAKAEAEAKARAEAEAKAKAQRQVASDKLRTASVQAVRGVPAGAPARQAPVSWAVASAGAITLGEDIAGTVLSRISAALAELRGIAAASLAGPVAATIAGLLYSQKVGAGSDVVPGRDISALVSADLLSLPDSVTLNKFVDTNTAVEMAVRGRLVLSEDGTLDLQLVRTAVPGTVPVVRAVKDTVTGYWGYTLPAIAGEPAHSILVSPADAPGASGGITLTGPVPLPETVTHTGGDVTVPAGATATTTPVADDVDFSDLVLVFPADSGLKPQYVMLRDRRNMPGTVSGKGQEVGDNWLGDAGTNLGAPIPSQVADKLRGRTFSSFDAFRRAVWKAVSDTPELREQFKNQNQANIINGKSPFTRKSERVGGRKRHELHHVVPISKGGAVYDIDNIAVMTPRRHIEVHKGDK